MFICDLVVFRFIFDNRVGLLMVDKDVEMQFLLERLGDSLEL